MIDMSTKSESHHILTAYGRADTVDGKVLDFLRRAGPAVRDTISEQLDLLTSTVCGAIDRLKKRELIEEHGTAYNERTKRNVNLYRVKEAACQN